MVQPMPVRARLGPGTASMNLPVPPLNPPKKKGGGGGCGQLPSAFGGGGGTPRHCGGPGGAADARWTGKYLMLGPIGTSAPHARPSPMACNDMRGTACPAGPSGMGNQGRGWSYTATLDREWGYRVAPPRGRTVHLSESFRIRDFHHRDPPPGGNTGDATPRPNWSPPAVQGPRGSQGCARAPEP
jgi:hypothetical protein